MKYLLTLAAAAAAATPALPGDGDDRGRRARVALAVAAAAAPPAAATAPAPREVRTPLSYPDGYRESLRLSLPLVTFVGCGPRAAEVDGAVVAAADSLPGYPGGTVVVSFPRNGEQEQFAKVRCGDDRAVGDAVRRAAAKMREKGVAPAAAPVKAPAPVDWMILAPADCGPLG